MDRRKARSGRRLVLASIISLIAAACGSATPSAAPSAAAPSVTPLAVTPEPVATGEGGLTADGKVLIRWFVGLGTGAQPDQIADEQAVVTAFNESQDKIVLSLEIYQNTTAYDILSTQIAAGNPPDIIGPVGFRGFYSYGDQLLDLQPLIDKTVTTCPASIPASSPRTRKGSAVRSGSRSRSTPRSSTTTRSCSRRPACPSRLTRSARSTTGRIGPGTPSPSSPRS